MIKTDHMVTMRLIGFLWDISAIKDVDNFIAIVQVLNSRVLQKRWMA